MDFRSDFTVELLDKMGDDNSIIRAMLVSTDKTADLDDPANAGRINFLMKNRHGTPFEHAAMTFYVEAPIMVFREWHRHRIGVSINEQSGRYSELPPMFYVPPAHRPLVQVGKPGAYTFVPGTDEQVKSTVTSIRCMAQGAYAEYQDMLNAGIAKEVARSVLPVNIYSKMHWTCNPRSLMAFLSLRTRHEDSLFPSFPQWEIQQCADKMEEVFASLFPLTHKAFVANGRVAP